LTLQNGNSDRNRTICDNELSFRFDSDWIGANHTF
jgi:hypothetical protein